MTSTPLTDEEWVDVARRSRASAAGRVEKPGWPPLPWPEGEAPDVGEGHVTLLAKRGPSIVWARTMAAKREIAGSTRGPIWAAWTGRYHTDIFEVPRSLVCRQLGVPERWRDTWKAQA